MEVAILKHSQRKLLFLCHKMLIRKESLNRLTVYVEYFDAKSLRNIKEKYECLTNTEI